VPPLVAEFVLDDDQFRHGSEQKIFTAEGT
jgi:hypothetical protein